MNGRDDVVADGMMSVRDAARFLAIGRTTLYELMDAGRLAYCKIGSGRRIPRRAVHAFAASVMVSASAPSQSA